jgi:NodT family efflux transporter outer membrane factor (OMF) lipoprotein
MSLVQAMRVIAAFAAIAMSMAACAVGPDYRRPGAPTPAAYKEMRGWKTAHPNDAIDRGAWWSVFKDPILDDLERRIDIGNQNLRAYEAAYRQSKAVVREARASLFPTVTASQNVTRQKSSGVTANSATLEGSAGWDLDLWGKVARQVESDVANAQASAAELASIRLSAQADLATYYFELRYEDSLQRLLDATVAAYKRTLDITRNQYAAGTVGRSDVVQAETQLQTTQASAIAVGLQRAKYEHAIALLIGRPPADLTIKPAALPEQVPSVPVSLPSALLERRPDIAQAERQMRQQNELIGVQVAAFFPDVNLSATLGYLGNPASGLFSAANQIWSLAASASTTVLDGGARPAAVAEARAAYDQSVASYRQTVLAAFQDVEDQLASIRILARQRRAQAAAVKSAQRAVEIVLNEYRAGTQAYTAVVTAQATALSAEETALQIQQNRVTSTVALIKALGGGWESSQLPLAGKLKNQPLLTE